MDILSTIFNLIMALPIVGWILRKFTPQISLSLHPNNPIRLYQERFEKQVMDGVTYYRKSSSNEAWGTYQGMDIVSLEGDYLIVRLTITNKVDKENHINHVEAKVVSPKDVAIDTILLQNVDITFNNELMRFPVHELSDHLKDFLSECMPDQMILEPNKTYYRIIAFRLVNFPKDIENVKIEIKVSDNYNDRSKVTFKFGVKDNTAFICH